MVQVHSPILYADVSQMVRTVSCRRFESDHRQAVCKLKQGVSYTIETNQ